MASQLPVMTNCSRLEFCLDADHLRGPFPPTPTTSTTNPNPNHPHTMAPQDFPLCAAFPEE